MALQFFAVHSEALAATHDALQRHASAHGMRPPGPTRALRIAQLYGHLQLRAAGRSSVVVALADLAATWRFQPRQLRQDLALLQALGWLSARGTTRGTVISLSGPDPADRSRGNRNGGDGNVGVVHGGDGIGNGQPEQGFPEPAATNPAKLDPTFPHAVQPESAAQPAPATPALPGIEPSPRVKASPTQTGESGNLLLRLAALYNQHGPSTWPAYQPRGNGLRSKLRQALRQAGSAEALADTMTAALRAMPPFWRHTYPQGRSGSECMAVLFSTDRGCAGLGVEFWHLFSWAQAAGDSNTESGGDWRGPDAPEQAVVQGSSDRAQTSGASPADGLQRAQRLFVWDSGVWRGQGREALMLTLQQKREIALLLEASGDGIPGTAARQFADPDPNPDPVREPGFDPILDTSPPSELSQGPTPPSRVEARTPEPDQTQPHNGPAKRARHRIDRSGPRHLIGSLSHSLPP